MIYNLNGLLDELIFIHDCENNISCNDTQCQNILRVSRTRYPSLIFNKNLHWILHVKILVMKLCSSSLQHLVFTMYVILYQFRLYVVYLITY